jgi:hypothetical protein
MSYERRGRDKEDGETSVNVTVTSPMQGLPVRDKTPASGEWDLPKQLPSDGVGQPRGRLGSPSSVNPGTTVGNNSEIGVNP